VKDIVLSFTPRHNGPGFRMLVTDQDKKRIGQIAVEAGVPIFDPKPGKGFISAELRAIADEMQRLGKRI
jgi:hypothetical protein